MPMQSFLYLTIFKEKSGFNYFFNFKFGYHTLEVFYNTISEEYIIEGEERIYRNLMELLHYCNGLTKSHISLNNFPRTFEIEPCIEFQMNE